MIGGRPSRPNARSILPQAASRHPVAATKVHLAAGHVHLGGGRRHHRDHRRGPVVRPAERRSRAGPDVAYRRTAGWRPRRLPGSYDDGRASLPAGGQQELPYPDEAPYLKPTSAPAVSLPVEALVVIQGSLARSVSDYIASVNLNTKVLDFVQLGGPILTIDRTVFELSLGAL